MRIETSLKRTHTRSADGGRTRSRWRYARSSWLAVCLFFLKYLRRHWISLSAALACLVVSVLLHLAQPWVLKVIFDYVLARDSAGNSPFDIFLHYTPATVLLMACAGLLVISALQGVFEYLHLILAGSAGQQITYTVRIRLHAQIQRLSLGFHHRNHSGDLLSRLIKEVNELRDFLSDSAIVLTGDLLFAAGLLFMLFAIDWRLALLSVLLLPLFLLSVGFFSGRIRGLTRKRMVKESKVAALFNDTLSAIQDIQLYSSEEAEERRFRSQSRASLRADLKALRAKGQLLRSVELLAAGGTCLVLWWGARGVLDGKLTPGDLLVFLTYLKSLFKPVRHIAQLSVRASKAVVAAERVMEVLRAEPEIRDAPDAVAAPPFRGEVEFRGVTFGYSRGQPVLRNICLRVEPGQTVAVVGHSGAGKSTLLALIPRLYDPQEGGVLLDGRDIRAYELAGVRSQITVVPQNPVLFTMSIRENICYGNPSATEEDILQAARLSDADEFIRRMPRGYDTPVGERGVLLSGGQRQRIALARALLRDAPIVILDEPMTGVDLESEENILRGLRNLLHDKTSFVIAHRLSTIRSADLVVILEQGRVVEMGPPDDLLRRGKHLTRMLDLEFGAESSYRLRPAGIGRT